MDHLTAVESLREGIGLRGYGQYDPLVEYKNEAYSMFERLLSSINQEFLRRIVLVEAEVTQIKERKDKEVEYKPASGIDLAREKEVVPVVKTTPSGVKKRKIGRNDPCWCGSGKKWKKCHYPELPE